MSNLKLNDISFRYKILGGFGVVLALLIVVAIAGFSGMSNVNNEQTFARRVAELGEDTLNLDMLIDKYQLTNDHSLMTEQIDPLVQEVSDDLNEILSFPGVNEENKKEIGKMLEQIKIYDEASDNYFVVGKAADDAYNAAVKTGTDLTAKTGNLGPTEQAALLKVRLAFMKYKDTPNEETYKAYNEAVTSVVNLFQASRVSVDITNTFTEYVKNFETFHTSQVELAKLLPVIDESLAKILGSDDTSDKNFGGAAALQASASEDAQAASTSASVMLLTFSAVSIVIGIIMAFFFTSMIVTPINSLVSVAKSVANGDLTVEVDSSKSGKDELGVMTKACGTMVANLQSLISNITQNATTISATAQQLAASSQQVNAATQQVSSAVQEVAAGGDNLAKQTTDASASAKSLTEEAGKGAQAATQATTKMNALAQAVNQSSEVVSSLGAKSQEIVKIVDTINNIASQTNLLALNAAIEAARAGEAGRGFAVVADEVRKLAEESQNATKEIETLIGGIKSSTDEAVASMDTGKKEVEASSEVVNQALAALETISTKVKSIEAVIGSVSAVAQQSASSSQQMSAGVQQTSSSMQQVASAAQQLASTSEELKAMVDQFKISESSHTNSNVIRPSHLTVANIHTSPASSSLDHAAAKSTGKASKPILTEEMMRKIQETKNKEETHTA